MEPFPKIRYFDRNKFGGLIKSITEEKNKTIKEKYFKEIAKKIILAEGITDNIVNGPGIKQIQGVPFDLIGLKGSNIIIIELKDSEYSLNFSDEVQLVRMERLIKRAREIGFVLSPILFQINLNYCLYCKWPSEFFLDYFRQTDKKVGLSRPIEPIVELIKKLIESNQIK